jgi:uncharacterized protein (DUF427 family)
MGLTMGSGPFGQHPAGSFGGRLQRPGSVVYTEPYPRRVRAVVDGQTVADSSSVLLVHETGLLPVYYFPTDDVRADLLSPAGTAPVSPLLGEAQRYTLQIGDRVAAAVWGFTEPPAAAPALVGHHAFAWDAVDHWYEEDDEVFGHPPDPYHRIDVRRSSREVRVLVDGVAVARSSAARVLFETGLPTRYYLPREDVDPAVLESSATHTRCAYKGVASYHSLRIGDRVRADLAWYYPEPAREGEEVRDLLCFFHERSGVQIEVDGRPVDSGRSMWEGEQIPDVPLPS